MSVGAAIERRALEDERRAGSAGDAVRAARDPAVAVERDPRTVGVGVWIVQDPALARGELARGPAAERRDVDRPRAHLLADAQRLLARRIGQFGVARRAPVRPRRRRRWSVRRREQLPERGIEGGDRSLRRRRPGCGLRRRQDGDRLVGRRRPRRRGAGTKADEAEREATAHHTPQAITPPDHPRRRGRRSLASVDLPLVRAVSRGGGRARPAEAGGGGGHGERRNARSAVMRSIGRVRVPWRRA